MILEQAPQEAHPEAFRAQPIASPLGSLFTMWIEDDDRSVKYKKKAKITSVLVTLAFIINIYCTSLDSVDSLSTMSILVEIFIKTLFT
jgi:hypothetical protein